VCVWGGGLSELKVFYSNNVTYVISYHTDNFTNFNDPYDI